MTQQHWCPEAYVIDPQHTETWEFSWCQLLSSLAAQKVVIMTTSSAASDDKVGIMITLLWQPPELTVMKSWHHDNTFMTTSSADSDDKVGIMITLLCQFELHHYLQSCLWSHFRWSLPSPTQNGKYPKWRIRCCHIKKWQWMILQTRVGRALPYVPRLTSTCCQ